MPVRYVDAFNHFFPKGLWDKMLASEGAAKDIGKRIEEQTGQKVELTTNVDPDVLGGLRMQVGNMIMDATVRSRLERLRKQVARAG